MGGTVLFQDALAQRLGVMQPSASGLAAFLASHPPAISPGIPALVAALQARGTGVYLVSGGFRQIINPIAASLGIPLADVFANTILFDVSPRREPPVVRFKFQQQGAAALHQKDSCIAPGIRCPCRRHSPRPSLLSDTGLITRQPPADES